MTTPRRPLPVYAYPGLLLDECDALKDVLGAEIHQPRFAHHHDRLVSALGAITEASDRVRDGAAKEGK